MFANAAIAFVLLVGAASSGLAAPMHVQTVSVPEQKFEALRQRCGLSPVRAFSPRNTTSF